MINRESDLRKKKNNSLPIELVGKWANQNGVKEFRRDGNFYVVSESFSWELQDEGIILDYSGRRYTRKYGDLNSIIGVWLLESNNDEEWNIRGDESYTYRLYPGEEVFGECIISVSEIPTKGTITTTEFRAYVEQVEETESVLIFDWVYMGSENASWVIVGDILTIDYTSGQEVYTRLVKL